MAGFLRTVIVAIAVIAGLPATPPAVASRAPAPACGVWRIESAPLPRKSLGYLTGIAAVSPTDVWAVGLWAEQNGSGQGHPLIEHWNGVRWSLVPGPSAGLYGLSAVAASSPNDVWAVGQAAKYPYTSIEHWNGVRWTLMPSPRVRAVHGNGGLVSVTAVSATDAWAVGTYNGGSALTEHWNGRRWAAVPSPNPLPPPGSRFPQYPDNVLSTVSATGPADVWAAGRNGSIPSKPLIEHWNGTRWQLVAVPGVTGQGGGVSSVVAHSPSDVWMLAGRTARTPALWIGHWNGSAWSQAPLAPGAAHVNGGPSALAVLGPRDAWAVGSTTPGPIGTRPVVLHWNGTQWRLTPTPAPSTTRAQLWAVAGIGTTVWAVGVNGPKGQQVPLIEQPTSC